MIWVCFVLFVFLLVGTDLYILSRSGRAHLSFDDSIRQTLLWVSLGLAFSGFIWWAYRTHFLGLGSMNGLGAREATLQYLTGYIIEQALSIDNLFVIALIMAYFKVPDRYQYKVLYWGIVGVLIMRGLMVTVGMTLIHYFSWMNYVFGAILIYAALKMAFTNSDDEIDFEKNRATRMLSKIMPISPQYDRGRFFTTVNAQKFATPLFIALLVVETTDVLFAFDSVPAVFSVTKDPFIVFSSNVFAILGLRALYFVLIASMRQFVWLETSLVVVLVFIGLKMLGEVYFPISIGVSLAIVVGLLVLGVVASLVFPKKEKE